MSRTPSDSGAGRAARHYPSDRLPVIANALSSQGSPTADIYFAWAFAGEIARGEVKRLSPTVFLAGDVLIVFRHDAFLRAAPPFRRLVYFTDDAVGGQAFDPGLPLDYRAKLALVEARAARRLLPRADTIAVASAGLAAAHAAAQPDTPVRLIGPAWPTAAGPLPAARPEGPVRIAYLGARSHARDFAVLAPILASVLDDHAGVTVTLSGEQSIPRSLRQDDRVLVAEPMDWDQYLGWARNRHFDIGLYPLTESRFNAARSRNKLLEYDQFGAAVIASARWSAAAPHSECGACRLLGDDPAEWRETIAGLVADPGAARRIAETNRAYIAAQDMKSEQRRQWLAILNG